MLTDTDHLRNLLGEYCARIDAGDFAGVGDLFARGGLAAGPLDAPAFVSGADAVAAFYASGTRIHEDGTPGTKHVVADTVIDEPASDGTVTARSSYVVHQAAKGFPLQPIIAGRYVDTFARDLERTGPFAGWHFVRRHFTVDLMGDLSHHWTGPT